MTKIRALMVLKVLVLVVLGVVLAFDLLSAGVAISRIAQKGYPVAVLFFVAVGTGLVFAVRAIWRWKLGRTVPARIWGRPV